jgi:hypothetical protein
MKKMDFFFNETPKATSMAWYEKDAQSWRGKSFGKKKLI